MNKLLLATVSAVVALALTSCTGDIVNSPQLPQTGATSADYQVVVDASEQVLADARAFLPEAAIVKADASVQDLETDRHRMSCSETTSQYTNRINYYLAEGTDEIAIIDEIRDKYIADGWQRGDSVAEQMGKEQDPEGLYPQSLRSTEDYGLDLSRGDDGQGGTILQMSVYSPCIGNPTDKPNSWGK
jgi:hypothetical protein